MSIIHDKSIPKFLLGVTRWQGATYIVGEWMCDTKRAVLNLVYNLLLEKFKLVGCWFNSGLLCRSIGILGLAVVLFPWSVLTMFTRFFLQPPPLQSASAQAITSWVHCTLPIFQYRHQVHLLFTVECEPLVFQDFFQELAHSGNYSPNSIDINFHMSRSMIRSRATWGELP